MKGGAGYGGRRRWWWWWWRLWILRGWDICVGSAGFCGLMEGRVLSSWYVVYVISSSVLSLRWQEKTERRVCGARSIVDILNKLLRVAEIRDVREIRASARKEG